MVQHSVKPTESWGTFSSETLDLPQSTVKYLFVPNYEPSISSEYPLLTLYLLSGSIELYLPIPYTHTAKVQHKLPRVSSGEGGI